MIVIDTRQQAQKHAEKEKYFAAVNIPTIRSKLVVGDYTRLDNQTICIDTKRNINEIASNICGKQHPRFRAECIRAQECGVKLIVLIEEIPPQNDLENWESPKKKSGNMITQIKGATLKKAMATMEQKYGVEFRFTTREKCPAEILKILNQGG